MSALSFNHITPIQNTSIQTSKPVYSISFEENLDTNVMLNKIASISRPNVFFWYIGAHGLKEDCVNFYRDKINHILSTENDASCWLLDLTAWGSFFKPEVKVSGKNRNAERINQFSIARLKCIACSSIFDEIKNVQQRSLVQYFHETVINKSWLLQPSSSFKESCIKIGDVFQRNCPVFEPIYEMDTSKYYSVVQYVEGCFLVNEVVKTNLNSSQIDIVFALPNDESKYYRDEKNSFLQDIEKFLSVEWGDKLSSKKINIHFLNFKYGSEPFDRPYNAGKKTIKNIELAQIR